MASHKIAIEFVHATATGGDVYLYTGGYPRRTMLWATYTIIS